jgi:TrmH family RNA methyltransferase
MEIITSRKNPAAVHLKKLGTDSAYRRETGLYLCQGFKLYEEAVNSGAVIREIMFCGDRPLIPAGAVAYRAANELLDYVSPMRSAPELVFSCAIPEKGGMPEDGRVIILEDIQDPGNVGTVIRTAAAFGFSCVILAGSCADPYSAKTVRASMGAVFKTKIYQCGPEDLRQLKLPIYAAALRNDAVNIQNISLPVSFALAVGNEGHGLSDILLQLASETVLIPMEAGNESLNAAIAAAVLMWESYKCVC